MPFTKARAERRTEWPTTWVQKGAACALARPKFAQRCAKVPDELARYDSVLTSFSGPSNLFVGKNRVVFLLEEPSSLFVGNVAQHPNQFAVDASRLITDRETVARRNCWKAGRYRMRGNLHDIVHHEFNASCHARTPDVLPRGLCTTLGLMLGLRPHGGFTEARTGPLRAFKGLAY